MDDPLPMRSRSLRVGCRRRSLEGLWKSQADDALRGMREVDLASHLRTRIADNLKKSELTPVVSLHRVLIIGGRYKTPGRRQAPGR